MSVFGGRNLFVAVAHEDLAYSSYVAEYSTGKFRDARYNMTYCENICIVLETFHTGCRAFMVVGFTTTCAISAYHLSSCEFETHS